MPPTHRAYSRDEAYPIGAEYEDENSGKKPKRPFDQVRAKNSFEKAVETLNEPFQEILRPPRHLFHFPGGKLCKNNQAQCNDPTNKHRIRDREAEYTVDFNGLLRQAIFRVFSFPHGRSM